MEARGTIFTVVCNLQGRVPRHWAKRPEDSYYQRRVIMPWVAIVGPHFTWITAGTAEMKTCHLYFACSVFAMHQNCVGERNSRKVNLGQFL